MIYLDTSALIKFVAAETESDEFFAWIADQTNVNRGLTSSDIGRVELLRAATRSTDEDAVTQARFLTTVISGIALTEDIVTSAQTIGPTHLRSLDAIHLASAVGIANQISAFVSYDKRLLDAARAEGLPVVSPGAA